MWEFFGLLFVNVLILIYAWSVCRKHYKNPAGYLIVKKGEDGSKLFVLELNKTPYELENSEKLWFEVKTESDYDEID